MEASRSVVQVVLLVVVPLEYQDLLPGLQAVYHLASLALAYLGSPVFLLVVKVFCPVYRENRAVLSL